MKASGVKVLALKTAAAAAPAETVEEIVSSGRLPEIDLEKGDSQSAVSKFYQGTVRKSIGISLYYVHLFFYLIYLFCFVFIV